MSRKPEYRPAQRVAICRSCDKAIERGEYMVSWYSYLNRGMHIHICPDCIKAMVELLPND